jgi:hypothetical protein
LYTNHRQVYPPEKKQFLQCFPINYHIISWYDILVYAYSIVSD